MVRYASIQRSRLIAPLVLAATVSWAAYAQDAAVKLDVPYVPTPQQVVDRMIELAEVGSDDIVIDLGSGDGRIAIAAAKAGARSALGVDIDPQRIREAKENAEKEDVTDRVTFRQQNLFETEISDATVITMYLLPRVNLDLRPRLLEELRPGTRIVSHAFNMGEWTPDQHERVDGRDVYLWIIPAKVDGKWEITEGDQRFEVSLKQEFQEVEGTATVNGESVPLKEVRLQGDEIEFVIERDGKPVRFSGKTNGDEMEGSTDTAQWTAKRTGRAT